MGKNEKTKLGRALVRHHNQMIQQTKEKGQFYRNQQKRILESVTDVNDIEAVIDNAEEAERLFSVENPVPNFIDVDAAASPEMTPEERRKQQKMEEALYASSLQVPRRPPWKVPVGEQGPPWKILSPEEVDINERRSFLIWRRNLARLEENEKLVLTPFEKNLDIWRQLWRVLERSDLLVMVVDARDPLFYRCPDLEEYAREIDRHKKTLLLVNKADLLPLSAREKWAEYFHQHGIPFAFWSAKAASAALEGKNLSGFLEKQTTSDRADYTDTKIYGRDELLARLQAEAEAIASTRRDIRANHAETGSDGSSPVPSKHAVVGFVGYPNVGKSSTINALVGEKRAGVTSTPGKTKHFQTLIISDELMLCDCPGLVFPSFSSSRYEMIASGVLPIDRMTEQREAIQVVANKVPRHAVETIYNITLPKPKSYELQSRPPLASELLRAFCASRGYVASSGLPDETRAARLILKDYIDGKLPHFEMPNVTSDGDTKDLDAAEPSYSAEYESDSSEDEDHPSDEESSINQEHVLDDLRSFDLSNGLAPTKAVVVNKKPSATSHKHHKKPQKKKDRSWRVRNDDGDGMPVVRVFQKTVNAGPLRVG